jgi:hypothetical protein
MSKYYRDNGELYQPVFKDGRTKQSFKDACDINKILKKAQVSGTISHLAKWQGEYGDFSEAPQDLLEAHGQLARGREIFAELPSEIRNEFNQDMFSFFEFVNDPKNADKLDKVLPALAEPGRQFPDVNRTSAATGGTRPPQEAVASATGGAEPVVAESPVEGDTGAPTPSVDA